MLLIDAYITAYCIFSQKDQRNRCLGEVFDERPDWQPPQQARTVINGSHLITICSVVLVGSLAFLIR